ncbi:hypothetical protein PMAYCL1PPCAC_15336, partial [Pristionchus mayeri]
QTRIPVYLSQLNGGTSTWIYLHFAQIQQAQRAVHFDYGNPITNLRKYGSMSPLPYNYSRIHTEIYLFWSRNDWLATPEDIEKILIPSMPKGVIKDSFEVPEYNHLDFGIATTAGDRIYRPIIEIIRKDHHIPLCAAKN